MKVDVRVADTSEDSLPEHVVATVDLRGNVRHIYRFTVEGRNRARRRYNPHAGRMVDAGPLAGMKLRLSRHRKVAGGALMAVTDHIPRAVADSLMNDHGAAEVVGK